MLLVWRTEHEMETSKVTLARRRLFLVRYAFLVWVIVATVFLTCVCVESGVLWRDSSAFRPICHWVDASMLCSCMLWLLMCLWSWYFTAEVFCVWTLIQEKESTSGTCFGGFVCLLVVGVGMELFWFPWTVARALLARLCKACDDLLTEG